MSSYFHGYLSDSDNDCAAIKSLSVDKEDNHEFQLDFFVNSDQLQSEKSDNTIVCSNESLKSLEKVDQTAPETCTRVELPKKVPSKIGAQKNIKKKRKNKYLNEFLEISSLDNIKTINVDSFKKSAQEEDLPGNSSRVGKSSMDRELLHSVNQKRKHQVSVFVSFFFFTFIYSHIYFR